MTFMDDARARVRGRRIRIVYPEGTEERAIRAAALLRDQDLAAPTIVGPEQAVRRRASDLGVPLEGIAVRDPSAGPWREDYARAYQELRRLKGVTAAQAAEKAALPHYHAALMVRAGDADGFVSGLDSATKPFLPYEGPSGSFHCAQNAAVIYGTNITVANKERRWFAADGLCCLPYDVCLSNVTATACSNCDQLALAKSCVQEDMFAVEQWPRCR